MSTDTLVERLRGNYVNGLTGDVRSFAPFIQPISLEAANEIERLQGLLKQFSKPASDFEVIATIHDKGKG